MGLSAVPKSSKFLASGKAFVWLTTPDDATHPDLLARYENLLDDEERRRLNAFRFADDRQLYLVAHALLRTSLSRHADVPPKAWRFTKDKLGRPKLFAHHPVNEHIQFNLSHTRGLAACAIARDVRIGIDVERLDRDVDSDSIAQRYFSRVESQQLSALSGDARRMRFLEYWTLKEAYVKAQGGGLSIPLNGFSFNRDGDRAWRIAFGNSMDDPREWQFACLRPTATHIVSVAIHRPRADDYELEIGSTVPLSTGP